MYGMVNRAFKDLISERFGETTWQEIRAKAGVEVDEFTSMSTYDDAITYDLAGAASEVLDTPIEELLRVFGHYWIEFAGKSSYAILLEQAGKTMGEVLGGLDEMHTRLALSFTELRPPSFRVLSDDGETIMLQYVSFRPALVPFVCGLVEGLADRLKVQVTVTHVEASSEDKPADLLRIQVSST
jgi:hypothetical protein